MARRMEPAGSRQAGTPAPPRLKPASIRLLAPLLGLLLLAFGLRVAGLGSQSIWVDEGFSIDFATRTASDMTAMWKARGGSGAVDNPPAAAAANDPLAIAVDIHPPLYYLVLHEWLPLAGRSEYAARFPSVMAGLLLVLALFKLGARLGRPMAGLAAAGVGAVAPFYVAYSQEARMYAPVAVFCAFSLYFTYVVLAQGRRPAATGGPGARWRTLAPWVGLVVCSSLAVYTHYSAVLVIGAENIIVAGVILWRFRGRAVGPQFPAPRPWPLVLTWAASQALVLLLFLPWLRTVIGQVASYNQNLWVPNWQLEMGETFRAFDSGKWPLPAGAVRWAIVASVVLVVGVALAGLRRANRRLLWFAGAALLLELGLALVAFQIRPEFDPRYLMVLATPYYLLLGLALAGLWRRWWPLGALGGVALAAVFVSGLNTYEFDPHFAKDDTRTLAQYLTSHTTAADVIITDAPEPLDYYYHGPAKIRYVPGDQATVEQAMNDDAAVKKRVVFVQWYLSTSDPEQLVPFLLQKYGRLVDDKPFRGYRERTYDLPRDAHFALSQPATVPKANFDDIVQLEGATFGPSANGEAQRLSELSRPLAVSGQNLMLALKWKLLQAATKEYKASVYLTDEHGHLGGQADLLLRNGQATTKRWMPGQESTDYYVMPTVDGLMPGRYNVNVAVYPDGGQERLSVLDGAGAPGGGSFVAGTVDVLPPTTPATGIPKTVQDHVAPGVDLVGFDLPRQPVAQGDALHLTLYWQATAQPPDGLKTAIALAPQGQPQAWQSSTAPKFPTGQWRQGDVFRDWYDPVLPPRLAPGGYQVLVGMGGRMVPVGQVEVLARQRSFDVPTPSHPLSARLGASIELLGYDLDKPAYRQGSTVRLTLYWRGTAAMTDSYTAFAHILDGSRHVVAQVDAIPNHGQSPTNSWLPGEVVQDTYELPLKADLVPGEYQLEVGFYRADTGVRLKASSTDVRTIDDGLLVGSLSVTK